MTTTAFDSLSYAKKLEAAGFTREQAEVQASALHEVIDARLVTKEHLDIRLKELELRLLKWQIGIGFALAVIMAKGFGWLGF